MNTSLFITGNFIAVLALFYGNCKDVTLGVRAFIPIITSCPSYISNTYTTRITTSTELYFFSNKSKNKNDNSNGPITQSDAQKYINIVSTKLKNDSQTISQLGKLTKVNNILGYGSPKPNVVAVRFNASFQKAGRGLSSKPLPFGLGQSNEKEGRGFMVGQVKASVDRKSGKVVECTVFRDLGYGRAFNLKC